MILHLHSLPSHQEGRADLAVRWVQEVRGSLSVLRLLSARTCPAVPWGPPRRRCQLDRELRSRPGGHRDLEDHFLLCLLCFPSVLGRRLHPCHHPLLGDLGDLLAQVDPLDPGYHLCRRDPSNLSLQVLPSLQPGLGVLGVRCGQLFRWDLRDQQDLSLQESRWGLEDPAGLLLPSGRLDPSLREDPSLPGNPSVPGDPLCRRCP